MRRITLGGTRYILVEFPRLVAADAVTNALTRVRDAGLMPVLAHPERYGCCSVEAVRVLAGPRRAHAGGRHHPALAADARAARAPAGRGRTRGHPRGRQSRRRSHDRRRAPTSSARRTARAQAELLTVRNPGAILRDEPLADVPAARDPPDLDAAPAPPARGRAVSAGRVEAALDRLAVAGGREQVARAAARSRGRRATPAVLRGGGTLYFCGNGGSAADAQHLATEYVVRYAAGPPAAGRGRAHAPTRRSSPPRATTSASSRSSPARSKPTAGRATCWCCTARAAGAPTCSPRLARPARRGTAHRGLPGPGRRGRWRRRWTRPWWCLPTRPARSRSSTSRSSTSSSSWSRRRSSARS